VKILVRVLLAIAALLVLATGGLFLAGMRSSAGHNEASVEIARPTAQVFPYFSDLQLMKTWVGWKEVSLLSEGELKVGSKFRVITGTDEYRVDLAGEVIELQPNQRLVLVLQSNDPSFQFTERAEFEVAGGDRTRASMKTKAQYGGFWRLMEPLVTQAAQKRLDDDVFRLKALAEARP